MAVLRLGVPAAVIVSRSHTAIIAMANALPCESSVMMDVHGGPSVGSFGTRFATVLFHLHETTKGIDALAAVQILAARFVHRLRLALLSVV